MLHPCNTPDNTLSPEFTGENSRYYNNVGCKTNTFTLQTHPKMNTPLTREMDLYLCDLAREIACSVYPDMGSFQHDVYWLEVYSTLAREAEEKLLAHV